MNIIILANFDLASNYALNLLLPELKQHNLRLYLSEKVGGKSNISIPYDLQQLEFFEQTLFNTILFPLIETSAETNPSTFKTFKQFEPYLQQPPKVIHSINVDSIISEFMDFRVDIIISIRFGLILKEAIIATSNYGVFNLHSGALPQLQGVMPTFRAMLQGDSHIHACLHYISNAEIDQGEIISTYSIPVDVNYSYLWNLLKLYEGSYKIIVDAINILEIKGKLNSSPQKGRSCYFSFPKSSELEEFSQKGLKLFDCNELLEIVALYVQKIR